MASRDPLRVSFGLSADSEARLRNEAGRWAKFDVEGKAYFEMGLVEVADKLKDAYVEEFTAAGHDKSGATLQTIRIEHGPMWVSLHIGGGAPFLESGTPPHGPIIAKALHWVDFETGEDVFATHVKGIPAEHIAERAMEHVKLDEALGQMAYRTLTKFDPGIRVSQVV